MGPTPQRRLSAIVHADVEGYSRRMAADEDATVRAVEELRARVDVLVREHRGRLVDFTGDSFLAEFASAVDAMSAALELQRGGTDLPVRIGVHAGEVRAEGERLFGDAIHVAARLQSLAEPGGICVSEVLREQVAGRMALDMRSLGAQELKNLGRAVTAYAVSLDPAVSSESPASVPGFGGRPAIAVLPFAALGGGPEQEYLGDGIADDLITRLATHRDFPVIARNSSFAYKGRSVDVKEIGRKLGVHYLIEGSIRRAGPRARVTAQLVDARTGHHVWAERWDRELADVFEIQDEIVEAVVSRVYPEVMRAERERVRKLDPAGLDVWDSVILARWYTNNFAREDNARAIALIERVLEREPDNSEAVRILGSAHVMAGVNMWTEQLPRDPSALVKHAYRALESHGETWQSLMCVGSALSIQGDFDAAIARLRRAAALNPSGVDVLIYLINTYTRGGRPEEALPLIELVKRLDPGDFAPNFRDFNFAMTYYALGRLEEGAYYARRSLEGTSRNASNVRMLLFCLAELGQLDEAREIATNMQADLPNFRISLLESIIPPQPSLVPRYKAALRKAGVPE